MDHDQIEKNVHLRGCQFVYQLVEIYTNTIHSLGLQILTKFGLGD
jgi:hypothetical protein